MSRRNIERPNRSPTRLLDEVLERRVLLYVLAAGTTLAGASAAQAKVVFTPSHAVLKNSYYGVPLQIDLNHDGVTDFTVVDSSNPFSFGTFVLYAFGEQSSNLIARQGQTGYYEAALRKGNHIGSRASFLNRGFLVAGNYNGPFYNTSNRYLGLEFMINGEVHYGWVGFRSVSVVNSRLTAVLGGWAYETEPNKPIVAGDEGEGMESNTMSSLRPTSLQLLAMGHTGIADRQRRIAGNV